MNEKRNFAFSLVETLVLLVVVSVAIAAMTPLLTRKIVNTVDPGTTAGGESHGRYECYTDSGGTVRERMYSGSTEIYNKAASAGKCKFIPPKNANDFVIYAVGGGGAGGGAGKDFIDSYTSAIKNEKLDVRTGTVFPQDILIWTSLLGSQTQNAVTSPMPAWFNWDTLNTNKNNKAFNFAIVGCGGAGGKGGDATWQSACDFECLRVRYMGPYSFSCMKQTWCPRTCWHTCYGTCTREDGTPYNCHWSCNPYDCSYWCCTQGRCAGAWCSTDYTYYTGYNIRCGAPNQYNIGGACGDCVDSVCEAVSYKRTNTPYPYVNSGGGGGARPPCAGLQSVISKVIPEGSGYELSGGGGDGAAGSSADLGNIGKSCGMIKSGSNSDGGNGGTYMLKINTTGYSINNNNKGTPFTSYISTAYSIGGRGGSKFTQDQYWIKLYNEKKVNYLKILNTTSSLPDGLPPSVIEALDHVEVDPTNSSGTGKFILGDELACNALNGPAAASGANGFVQPASATCGGNVARGAKCSTGIYSEIYTWRTPYATKYLGYGESGKPGNYETLKVATFSGPVDITLGRGGKWANNDWQLEGPKSNGPDGTNTIVGNILVAKGGVGGKGSLKTNRYELCHMADQGKDGKCNKNSRTTDDIEAIKEKLSGFSYIGSAVVGNSSLLGGKYGKGGLGGGSQSTSEYICGLRNVINTSPGTISTGLSEAQRTIHNDPAGGGCPGDANGYKNVYMPTSAAGLSGGDGAVIITW